jgi:hypothetical protein
VVGGDPERLCHRYRHMITFGGSPNPTKLNRGADFWALGMGTAGNRGRVTFRRLVGLWTVRAAGHLGQQHRAKLSGP